MNCERFVDLLPLYIDDVLESDQKAELEKHLSDCKDCKEELKFLREIMTDLSQMDLVSPPEGFRESLMVRIKEEPKKQSFFLGWKKYAALAAVFVIGISIYSMGQNLFYYGMRGGMPKSQEAEFVRDSAPPGLGMLGGTNDMANDTRGKAEAPKLPQSEGIESKQAFEEKIIYNGSLGLATEKFQETYDGIISFTNSNGGFIEFSNTWKDRGQNLSYANLTLRVPDRVFFMAFDVISNMDVEVENTTLNSRNVTEDYYDLDNRITNLKRQEERIREILREARTVDEILRVEQELNRVRMDIESLEGRLRFLDHQVTYSTIHVNMREIKHSGTMIQSQGFKGLGSRMYKAFVESINRTIEGTGNFLVSLAAFIPRLIIILAIFFGIWKLFKKQILALLARFKRH